MSLIDITIPDRQRAYYLGMSYERFIKSRAELRMQAKKLKEVETVELSKRPKATT